MPNTIDQVLRRMARRYVVRRRTFDGLTARYDETVAEKNRLGENYRELAKRHEDVVADKAALDASYQELSVRHAEVAAERDYLDATYRTWTPPGSFYSPYPDKAEIARRADAIFGQSALPTGVDLRVEDQVKLFDLLTEFARDLPFPAERNEEYRYFFGNPEYSWSDGIVLHAMLRHIRPRRMIEVGSGYSSAMTLDTVDGWLDGGTELTFVEPHPQNLRELLRPEDKERVTVLEHPVQDVSVEVFTRLDAGDLLFIDSTHVVKAGSDVNYLFFEVLPRLNDGVWVHLHDIFFPFEYPREWIVEGRAWQEAYLLRAFLMFNRRFEIRWFQQYMWTHHRELLVDRMPEMGGNSGGNIWLQKIAEP